MALRPDKYIIESDGTCYLNDVAAKGVILVYSTAGSGAALGDSRNLVTLAASASGTKVAGILQQDFVNIDETRFHINWHKEEQNIGDNCDMGKKGWWHTDKVTGSPTVGDKAYLTANGVVTPTISSTGGLVATPLVGEFGGAKDEHGFVKLILNLP